MKKWKEEVRQYEYAGTRNMKIAQKKYVVEIKTI
jgi:hypothetical protein